MGNLRWTYLRWSRFQSLPAVTATLSVGRQGPRQSFSKMANFGGDLAFYGSPPLKILHKVYEAWHDTPYSVSSHPLCIPAWMTPGTMYASGAGLSNCKLIIGRQ